MDFLTLIQTKDLVYWMSKFIKEIRKDSGEAYQIDSITAFAFSLQKVLKETGRQIDILRNERFVPFLEAMNSAMDLSVKTVVLNPTPRNEEEDLWRNNELGVGSPETLIMTITAIVVKHLKLRSSQAHRDLDLSSFEKCRIFNPNNPTQIIEIYRYTSKQASQAAQSLYGGLAAASLGLPIGQTNLGQITNQLKKVEILPNLENPNRCPVRILDFYIEKRPVAIKNSGPLYLWPSDLTKSPMPFCWYKVKPLSKKYLLKCLFKIKQTNLK